MQAVYAPVVEKDQVIAVLCLGMEPRKILFNLLKAGYSGKTGEVYFFQGDGKLVTPSRFIPELVNEQKLSPSAAANAQLWARVPHRTRSGLWGEVADSTASPLTKVAEAILKQQKSGFLDGYYDYRGELVVGAGKWIPELGLGLVVEQDENEVYGPYHFARNAILVLSAIAIVLINALIWISYQSRKNLSIREQRFRGLINNIRQRYICATGTASTW